MPSTPIPVYAQYRGGNLSKLNVTTAQVVKSSPGCLYKIVIIAAGSSGSLTINDYNATGAGNTAANEIWTIAQSTLVVGQIYSFEWPCLVGISVSAVPAGAPNFSISFY